MKAVTVFEASDGKRFSNAGECEVYEQIIEFGGAVGMTFN